MCRCLSLVAPLALLLGCANGSSPTVSGPDPQPGVYPPNGGDGGLVGHDGSLSSADGSSGSWDAAFGPGLDGSWPMADAAMPLLDSGAPEPGADAGPGCLPRPESCDGTDEDCDSRVDEGACSAPIVSPFGQPLMHAFECHGSSSVTLRWASVPGAEAYPVRVNDTSANCGTSVSGPHNDGCVSPTEYVLGNPGSYLEQSVTVSITAGVTYQWWVHAHSAAGGWSTHTKRAFRCPETADGAMPIDVFLIAGQSNAVGWSGSSGSPSVSASVALQFHDGALSAASDPVGGADGGSAWPSFAMAYHSLTGRILAFVPAAVPGTGQLDISDTGTGHWGHNGALVDNAAWKLDQALMALREQGYAPHLRGVLWSQGENDAQAINNGTLQVTTYAQAMTAMIIRFRAAYGVNLPVFMFQTGTSPAESDSGYAAVRSAQSSIVGSDAAVHLVFTGARDFAARGLMRDAYHYTQPAYNEMGNEGGRRVASLVGP